MGYGQKVKSFGIHEFREKTVAQFPGGHLGGYGVLGRIGMGVKGTGKDLYPVGTPPLHDRVHVSVAFLSPEGKIHMGHGENRMQLRMQEKRGHAHRVYAAAYPQKIAVLADTPSGEREQFPVKNLFRRHSGLIY